ncbi:MAG: phospholipase D-like domain-containing protein [Flavobacteriales bacterium]
MRLLLLTTLVLVASAFSAQTIQEIQGEADASPFENQTVTTSGVVTATSGIGYYIQDGAGPWSGIYVYDDGAPAIGDHVTVTANVAEYYELTELDFVESLIINSSDNPLPEPEMLSTADVADEQWEGVLVRVEGATCTNTDLGFGEFELDDGSGPCRVDDALYLYTPTAGTVYAVTGPQTYTFGNYKILPRSEADISIDAALYFTEMLEEFDLSTSGFSVTWATNAPAQTEFEFGLTPAYELGSILNADLLTEHEATVNGLSPAQIVYVRARAANADGETAWISRVCCTASESSGDIEVLFTQAPDTSVATFSQAKWTSNITDSIVDYISAAQATLDIAMYDLNGCPSAIMEAINDRADAGVLVRFITDEEPENLSLDMLNPEIPVLAGNTEGIMHDKFLLIDRDDPQNSWVITGSVNYTPANLGWDFNNHVRIQDQSLCRAYTLEFEEMWGSTGSNFDVDQSAFASQKTDNTPHKFLIGGREVELYFSPSDGTTGQISEHLQATQDRMGFAVMTFTENSLGQAVINVNNAIGQVLGVIDYVESSGSEFDFLVNAGVDVVDYQNADGSQWPDGPVMHSKYAIVDYGYDDPDPVTITGSHNWTASAGSINDENTLIIHDGEIANWFLQDLLGIRNFLGAVSVSGPEALEAGLVVYPNPTSSTAQVRVGFDGTLNVVDALGRTVLQREVRAGSLEQVTLATGAYTVRVSNAQRSGFARLLVR